MTKQNFSSIELIPKKFICSVATNDQTNECGGGRGHSWIERNDKKKLVYFKKLCSLQLINFSFKTIYIELNYVWIAHFWNSKFLDDPSDGEPTKKNVVYLKKHATLQLIARVFHSIMLQRRSMALMSTHFYQVPTERNDDDDPCHRSNSAGRCIILTVHTAIIDRSIHLHARRDTALAVP